MERQFEVEKGVGRKALVILHPACGIDRGGILELLRQAGIDPADVIFAEPFDAAGGEAQDRCVVIPVDAAVSEAPELADAARRCSQTSSGLVVVFAEGFNYPGPTRSPERTGRSVAGGKTNCAPGLLRTTSRAGP